MHQQRTDGVGVRRTWTVALGVTGLMLVACSSTPPPRPLPEPRSQQPTQLAERPRTTQPERSTSQADALAREASPTPAAPARSAAETGPPGWFRDGAFEIDGREHRAFAVTAADVRAARGQAMALAYERYPRGHVAAHEAVRQADGSWRFYVLMAAGG